MHVRYVELSGFRNDVEPFETGFTILPIEYVFIYYYIVASNMTRLAQGSEDVRFHSIFTEEIRPDEESPPTGYCAIQTLDKPLEFFNE